jgi:hypothetical protein
VLNFFFEFFVFWVPEMGTMKKSRNKKQNVWSLFGRESTNKSLLEREKALSLLSCVGTIESIDTLIEKLSLSKKKKKASYSPRALLFSVSDSREKKKCSPPRKHDPP